MGQSQQARDKLCVKHATARGMRHGKAFETTEVREKKDLDHKFPVEGKGYIYKRSPEK